MNDVSPARPAKAPHRYARLATLLNTIATWDERLHFRRSLAQASKDNPHLISDIGLTKRQAEAEIGKPFWQA